MYNIISFGIPIDPIPLDDWDSQLLYHYIESTSLTISNDDETQALWQVAIPQLAHRHSFLMHGILACAALHKAYLQPSRQHACIIQATSYQNIALPAFRSAMAEPTLENCEALLVFSHLLVIYSFASEKQDETLFLSETKHDENSDVVPPWLYFLRNGCSLLCDVWVHLESSPVRELAAMWDIPIVVPDSQTSLVTYLLSIIPSSSAPSAWSPETIHIYTKSIHDLGAAFLATHLSTTFNTWDAIRVWPMCIDIEYMGLLKARHPSALILLAHYCVLLGKVKDQWYCEGRAKRLLESILRYLDTEWLGCIQWPLEEVGVGTGSVYVEAISED